MDRVVLSYYDYLVRERDLCTLVEGRWINDVILSFGFEYLRHSRLTDRNRLLLVDPAVTQLLKLSDYASAQILLDSLNCAHMDWLLFLVNDSESRHSGGGSHWTLLVVSPKLDRSYHLDPLYSQVNFDASLRIARHIAAFCEKPKLSEVIHLNVAKQNNACDCGIYCLVYAEQLCSYLLDGNSEWQKDGLVSPDIHQLVANKRSELTNCIRTLAASGKQYT
ncbi:unnamed protein product [Echinostoma caproni]|uniref:ULP_PROTEASE domain-containing protein n=1 Tax=Echinostoma caproni TaxID=27848 RepID=A0A183B1N3_9TREM|nr:unnamed protein product [Echinostoma caproni]